MPRYYCDYCDTYLTHDSPSVRKQHNAGYKHKANVRDYYQQFEAQQTQSLIDQKIKEHLGQAAAFQNQVGATFHQHLAGFPAQRPRLPILPTPMMPIPGSSQPLMNPQLMQPGRPIMQPPFSGYVTASSAPQLSMPPGLTSLPMQMNGLPRPPPMVNMPPSVSSSVPSSDSPSATNP